MSAPGPSALSDRMLDEIEATAVELARLAGAEIVTALGKALAIQYKGASSDGATWKDPVCEVDRNAETLIRARLAERFPGHDILGEEMDERPGRDSDFVWTVDPIDGTANFLNGFPLFAASIGVLHGGRPIAGALWCSTSHALRSGVYHAREGGGLHFDEEEIAPSGNPAIRRHLAGEPVATIRDDLPWEIRKTGSAAIECAFVAASLLRVARFEQPHVWDVAGGLSLVMAAGGEIRMFDQGAWVPFESFEPVAGAHADSADLQHWRRPLILGDADAVSLLCAARSP